MSKVKTKQKIRPMDADTFNKVCKLKTDNRSTKNFWILVNDGSVNIAKQVSGNPAEASICIPKSDFNKLIAWYIKEQKIN